MHVHGVAREPEDELRYARGMLKNILTWRKGSCKAVTRCTMKCHKPNEDTKGEVGITGICTTIESQNRWLDHLKIKPENRMPGCMEA